jgi:hypothetical protein
VQECVNCPAVWITLSIVILAGLAPFGFMFLWARWHMKTRYIYKSQSAAIFKVLFNFVQTCSMMAWYQSHFPPFMEITLGLQLASTSFFAFIRFGLGCMLDLSPDRTFALWVYFELGWPTLCLVIFGIAVSLNAYHQRLDKVNARLLRLSMLLYVAFPSIVKAAFQSFVCTEVDPGHMVLAAEASIQCDTADRMSLIGIAGLLSGILIPAIPIVLVAPILRARRSNTLGEDTVLWRYGWLYSEYEYVLWEIAVLLRKVTIVLIPDVFVASTAQTRYLAATCALFFATVTHALLLPYSGPFAVTAQCELFALLCTFAVFACGFFSQGLLANDDIPPLSSAWAADHAPGVAIVCIVLVAITFFGTMLRLVGVLERDETHQSGPITWVDIQVYFRYMMRLSARSCFAARPCCCKRAPSGESWHKRVAPEPGPPPATKAASGFDPDTRRKKKSRRSRGP